MGAMWRFLGDNAATILALCALAFTAYQVLSTRKHNRLSVRPHITYFTYRNLNPGQGSLKIEIMNNGLGPAVIDAFEVSLDNKRLPSQNSSDIEAKISAILNGQATRTSVTTLGSGYCMPKDQTRALLELHFPATSHGDIQNIEKLLTRFSLVIHYSSMYGDRYTFDSQKG